MKFKDLTGQKFSSLTVVKKTNERYHKKIVWECICDCGKVVKATGNHLSCGNVKSCGCIKIKHGYSSTVKGKHSGTYSCWQMMFQRCSNPNHVRYKNYGGRGITVCERWRDFSNFLEDMGERPEGKSIDRIDVNLGYFKENCRWATSKEQQNNLSNNRKVNYKGEMITVTKLAEILKIDRYVLYARLNRAGWDVEKVERKIKKQ